MSSGHFHTDLKNEAATRAELAQLLRQPKIYARLFDSKFRINRDFDIPYVAGYSKDGRVIYIDRHLPISLVIGSRRVHVFPFLITHERTEKALLDLAGMRYNEAHKYATMAEHKELNKAGISPVLYERALDPYIKADQHEKIVRVPMDLDMRPYRDSNDIALLNRMRDKITNV